MMRTMGMTMKIIKESKTFNFSSNSSPSNSQYQYNPKSHLIITPSRDQEIPSRHPSFYSCFLKVDRFEQIRWFGGSGDRSKTGDQASFDYRSFDRRKIVEIMLWIPVGIFFFDRIVGIVKITGTSMQPTLNPDSSCLVEDIVIVTKFDQKLDRGDIVTFRHPSDPCLVLAKRIIGLEKDLVKVRKTNDLNLTGVIQIPSGHCWVEGDDKFHSKDSNQFGPIPMGLITGKVVMILWPISRFGPVDSSRLKLKGSNSNHDKKRIIVASNS